jgi:hypothetical protein
MIGIEEARVVDISADVLDHHVRRIAPAADGDVAVRLGEAVERGSVGAFDDLEAGARGRVESTRVDRTDAREVGTQGGGIGLLSGG